MNTNKIPAQVLADWRRLADACPTRITAGLINQTYRLDCDNESFVLQCLHPVFGGQVNYDIQAVTGELTRQRLATPTIVPCDNGALWSEHDGQVWRLLTYIAGHTVHAITNSTAAFEAGRIAAVFHSALSDFDYEYESGRGHVHDTPRHLKNLRTTIQNHSEHRLHEEVEPLARRILAASDRYEEIDELPLRHCHGDLKVSNILFDDCDKAICLLDLDTVNRMTWPLEMGDALRSWCNPRTEDQLSANLDLDILDAAMTGYATAMPPWLSQPEKEKLIAGLARICLELAARFLADALNENYFGWDQQTYASRGDHNLARGKAMAALYNDVLSKRSAAEKIAADRLGTQI